MLSIWPDFFLSTGMVNVRRSMLTHEGMQHLGLLDCLSWHKMSRDRDIILYLSYSVVYKLFTN